MKTYIRSIVLDRTETTPVYYGSENQLVEQDKTKPANEKTN